MNVKSIFSLRKWLKLFAGTEYAKKMDDKSYLKLKYYAYMGKKLDLDNPTTFNEKIQWLKINDRKSIYTICVDKYAVKQYVSEAIGAQYVIPLLGIWNKPEEINFDALPVQFVLKVTHDSGGLVICRNKAELNKEEVCRKLNKSLNRDYYIVHREWPYKDVPRRIIAEQFLEDEATSELRDYKFFCFDGVPKIMFVATGRQNRERETCFDFFDMDYNHLEIKNGHPMAEIMPEKPVNFELMKHLASILSQHIPQVRVDFYEVNGRVYFGEMTFSHWSGIVPFEPTEWDLKLGEWINLP